jgi:hypothetical protein
MQTIACNGPSARKALVEGTLFLVVSAQPLYESCVAPPLLNMRVNRDTNGLCHGLIIRTRDKLQRGSSLVIKSQSHRLSHQIVSTSFRLLGYMPSQRIERISNQVKWETYLPIKTPDSLDCIQCAA